MTEDGVNVLNQMIEGLERKLTALRYDLDLVVNPVTEILIQIEITKLTEELRRLQNLKNIVEGGL